MNEFEKVEKLREKANVSFEDAKDALTRANGDLLDAMILLEKEGKVVAQGAYYKTEEKAAYCNECKKNDDGKAFGDKVKSFVHKVWIAGSENFFVITKGDETIAKLPAWVFVVLLLFAFWFTIPAMIVGLFFDCRYHFVGKDDLAVINKAMDKVGETAEKVKDGFNK